MRLKQVENLWFLVLWLSSSVQKCICNFLEINITVWLLHFLHSVEWTKKLLNLTLPVQFSPSTQTNVKFPRFVPGGGGKGVPVSIWFDFFFDLPHYSAGYCRFWCLPFGRTEYWRQQNTIWLAMAFCVRTHLAPAELRFKVLTVQQTNFGVSKQGWFYCLIVMFITTLESYFWSNHIFLLLVSN